MDSPSPTDTLIVRTGRSPGPELRHCIRSLTTMLPVTRLITYGCDVPWLDCEQHVMDQPGGKYAGAYAVLRAVLADDTLPETVVIADDDMFAMRAFDVLPEYHCGPLGEVNPGRRGTGWQLTLAVAGRDALCRDLHVPSAVERSVLAERLDALPRPERVWWRTLAGGGDVLGIDAKVRDARTVPDGDWVSTNPTSWGGKCGAWLRERFGEACEWER